MKAIRIPTTNKELVNYLSDVLKPGEDYYPVDPMFHEQKAQLKYTMWRLDSGATRYYWSPDFWELFGNDLFHQEQNGFGASVTSIIGLMGEEKPWLRQWQSRMGGFDQAEEYKEFRADYGTLMHILITELFRIKQIDLSVLPEIVNEYVRLNELWFQDTSGWANDLKNDLTSLIQWVNDYEVVPIALEVPIYVPVFHPMTGEVVYMAGGTPDLVCWMNDKNYSEKTPKYKRKRVTAIIDFKSGRKGFFDEHRIQRKVYMDAWNWNMERWIVDRRSTSRFVADICANWAPTASRGAEQTYKFEIHRDKHDQLVKKWYHYVANFIHDGNHLVSDVRNIGGTLKMGDSTGPNVKMQSAEAYMRDKWKEFNEAEAARATAQLNQAEAK